MNVGEKIREWLGLKRDSEITYYMDQSNMRVGSYVSVAMLVFILVRLIQMPKCAAEHVSGELRGEWLQTHTVVYGLGILLSIFMLVNSVRFLKGKNTGHKSAVLTVLLGTVGIAAIGMFLAYNDYFHSEHIYLFLALIFGACGMFILHPMYSLGYLVISFLGFLCFMTQRFEEITGDGLNLLLVLVILILVSWSRYNEARFMAKNQVAVLRLSHYDRLTGAKNLHSMEVDYNNYIGKDLIMVMADIDDFKFYNDRNGHEAGDEVIREIVQLAMNMPLSREDAKKEVYRISGDETCIVFEGLSEDEAVLWLECFADEVRRIQKNGYSLYLTLSMGMIYGKPEHVDDLKDYYRFADRKMFEAKKEGGARILTASFEEMLESDKAPDFGFNNVYEKDDADPLTGLPNMMRFRDRAKKLMVEKNLHYTPYGFVFFNIVNFKAYNERYGFQNGDLMIKQFGAIIMNAFEDCLVSRFGGDEFVVVSPLDHLIDRIEDVHHGVHAIQQDIRLEVKAGIYRPAEGETNVSIACDRAKVVCDSIRHNFEAIYKYYDESMMRDLKKKQYIVDTIDEAIEKGYIEVYYQPVMRAVSGELASFEVLARWNDPRFGFLQPGEFIDVLEQNRLIYKIDRFVARQACRDARTLHDMGYAVVPLSFNISRVDFDLCDMVGIVEDAVQEYGLPKDLVHVEITESALIDNEDYLSGEIGRFHSRGYQVWMDDFGSGYSSLNSLQDYNFDVLKIDMIFLKHYESNAKSRKILASVVDMCKKVGIHTLAEGVETEQQLSFLRSIGCEKVQGYLFDKPLPFNDVVERFDSGKFKSESRMNRDYFETIGRVNLLSQAPMEFFERHKKSISGVELFAGTPLAIAECLPGPTFHYLVANDRYMEMIRSIGRKGMEESADQINALSDEMKQVFFRGLAESRKTGHASRVEFVIDGRTYITKIQYITSNGDREALLLGLAGTGDDNMNVI